MSLPKLLLCKAIPKHAIKAYSGV